MSETTSAAPASRKECRDCLRGDSPILLDADGVLATASGKMGKWSHSSGDFFWPCTDPPREELPYA